MYSLILSMFVLTNGSFEYQTHVLDSGLTYEDCIHGLWEGEYHLDHLEHSEAFVSCEEVNTND